MCKPADLGRLQASRRSHTVTVYPQKQAGAMPRTPDFLPGLGPPAAVGSLSPLADYDASGDVLKVLLHSGYKLPGSVTNFLWSTGTVRASHNETEGTPLERMILRAVSRPVDAAVYETSLSGALGFSSPHPGEILVQPLGVNGLFVFSEAFLCASQNVSVSYSPLPVTGSIFNIALHSSSLPWHSVLFCSIQPTDSPSSPRPLIFLQSGKQILEKALMPTETFVVNLHSLVAFDDQVTLTMMERASECFPLSSAALTQVVVKGPGMIYLSGCNAAHTRVAPGGESRLSRRMRAPNAPVSILISLGRFIVLIVLTCLLVKLVLMLDTLAGLDL